MQISLITVLTINVTMKTAKRIALVCSALGVLVTVQKYRHKKRHTAIRRSRLKKDAESIQPESILKIYNLTEDQAKEEFKNKIAAGEDMSEQEYVAYIEVMRHEKKSYEVTAN